MCRCNFGHAMKTCHCAGCHRTFTSVEAFDRHQRITADGLACLDPAFLCREDGKPLYEPHAGQWRVSRPARPTPHYRAAMAP